MKTKSLFYTLSIVLFSLMSCEKNADVDFTPSVMFQFESGENLVKASKGAKEYTVKGTITSTVGLKSFSISTANAETGAAGSVIETTKQTFEEPKTSYDFSYTITDLIENKAIKINVSDAEGEDFQKNFVVEITPAVIFSEAGEKKLESLDKYWGVFYAEWLYGRVYKSRQGVEYAKEINIGMENQEGKAVLVSPAKHSLTFAGARTTKFGVTTLTQPEFNTISRVDDTLLKTFSPTAESVIIEKGKVYSYETQDGQKGAIYIQNLTGDATNEQDKTVTAVIVTKLQAK